MTAPVHQAAHDAFANHRDAKFPEIENAGRVLVEAIADLERHGREGSVSSIAVVRVSASQLRTQLDGLLQGLQKDLAGLRSELWR